MISKYYNSGQNQSVSPTKNTKIPRLKILFFADFYARKKPSKIGHPRLWALITWNQTLVRGKQPAANI